MFIKKEKSGYSVWCWFKDCKYPLRAGQFKTLDEAGFFLKEEEQDEYEELPKKAFDKQDAVWKNIFKRLKTIKAPLKVRKAGQKLLKTRQ